MSRARTSFDGAIEDATALLQQFDAVHKDNQNTGEVLKRAGLVMALTAWETYVEDRITEAVTTRLKAVNGSPLGKFVNSKLGEELRRFWKSAAWRSSSRMREKRVQCQATRATSTTRSGFSACTPAGCFVQASGLLVTSLR